MARSKAALPGGLATCVWPLGGADLGVQHNFSYLNYATMAFKQGDTTLNKVAYEPRMLGFDRWASTEAKLIFLLDELISNPSRLPQ
jgi:hypothetical protein